MRINIALELTTSANNSSQLYYFIKNSIRDIHPELFVTSIHNNCAEYIKWQVRISTLCNQSKTYILLHDVVRTIQNIVGDIDYSWRVSTGFDFPEW